MPIEEREAVFDEVVRVAAPGGLILHLATWVPDHPQVTITDVRVRQDWDRSDQGGGTPQVSILTVGVFLPDDRRTTVEDVQLDDATPLPRPTVARRRRHVANRYADSPSSLDQVDPRIVDERRQTFACPVCGDGRLAHLGGPHDPTPDETEPFYECPSCAFRPTREEVLAARDSNERGGRCGSQSSGQPPTLNALSSSDDGGGTDRCTRDTNSGVSDRSVPSWALTEATTSDRRRQATLLDTTDETGGSHR